MRETSTNTLLRPFCSVNVCYVMVNLVVAFFSLFLFCCKDEMLVDWVNPMYLDTGVVKDIRARFKEESEIQLQEFLLVNTCLC